MCFKIFSQKRCRIISIFRKCGDKDASVTTFVANVFIALDNSAQQSFSRICASYISFSGSILGSSQFTLLPQAASKNDAQLKSGQNQLENNHFPSLI
jgi:hypothetical protein